MPNTSRGNFSLLTLLVVVIAAGVLMALNMENVAISLDNDSANCNAGWPLLVYGKSGFIPPNLAFDLMVNLAILAAVGFGCERWNKSTHRAGLQATSPFDQKNQD